MRIIITENQLKLITEQLDSSQFVRASDLKASQWYWDHIRDEESLKCKAYNIGDGKWTIGYGHTEGVKEGDVLGDGENCEKEATEKLQEDSNYHAKRLRKIFKKWEDEGIYVPITQNMYDSLLSLSFNGGSGGLMRSNVIALLKSIGVLDSNDYKKAAETIKTYRVSSKFPGLTDRREKEYQHFVKGLR